jgi:hypothetical protein
MTLDELLQMVESSDASGWHKFEVGTVYGWEYGQKGGQNYLEPKTHDVLAVYRNDIDISLVFAATVNEDFAEPWCQKFPSAKAQSVAVWLRYRGQLVYERVCVVVDGGRYLLPMPEHVGGTFQVHQSQLPIARLLFDLFRPGGPLGPLESVLNVAGVAVV